MASQTKVEPVEEASASAVPNAAASAGGKAMGRGDDEIEDDEPAPGAMAGAALAGDDEDVSIDELLISDGADDDDDEDDATEVHEGLQRVAMQELGALQMADADDDPLQPGAVEGLEATDDSPLSVELEALSSELASSGVESKILEVTPHSEERPSAAAEASETDVEAPSSQELAEVADESAEPASLSAPPAAPEQAAANRETMAAGAAQAQTEEPSVPETPVIVSDSGLEADEAVVSEVIPDVVEGRAAAAAAEPTPPPLEDDKDEREAELEPVQAEASDGPLPSFDIPELEAGSNVARPPVGLAPEFEPLVEVDPGLGAAPLEPLSEATDDDDDDAVTHIGLPVPDAGAEYPAIPEPSFNAAEPAVAALAAYDTAAVEARRAKTRVIPRMDPSQLPPGAADRRPDTMRPFSGSARQAAVSTWFARIMRRGNPEAPSAFGDGAPVGAGRGLSWLVDNVLPSLSLILVGSAIGAFIMLLQERGGNAGEQSQTVQTLKDSGAVAKRPTTLLERAEAGDGDALFKITNMAPNERTSALTLALEAGSRAQKLNEFYEFSKGLASPPNEVGSALLARIIGYATSAETMLPTFQLLSQWTGPRGPDVMYAIWERAGSSRAASLAQELLHSADLRAKATPALAAAVDLRAATTCDDYQAVLPAVVRSGDQRCIAALRTLKHTDGCGDDGQQDCYACLRDSNQLDEALSAVEKRPAPAL